MSALHDQSIQGRQLDAQLVDARTHALKHTHSHTRTNIRFAGHLPAVLTNGILAINERNPEWGRWACANRIAVIPYVSNTEISRVTRSLVGGEEDTELEGGRNAVDSTTARWISCWHKFCGRSVPSQHHASSGSARAGVTSQRCPRWRQALAECKDLRVSFIGTRRWREDEQDSAAAAADIAAATATATAPRRFVERLRGLWPQPAPLPSLVHIEVLTDASEFHTQSQATHYAQVMLRTQLCLVPAGDTPTSRRLFDAIAVRLPLQFQLEDECVQVLLLSVVCVSWGIRCS